MFKRYRKNNKNLSIKRKLLYINMIVAILPVLIFGMLLTNVYDNAVNKRTLQSVQNSNVVISDRITRILKDAENCSNYITVNINKVIENNKASKQMSLAEKKAVNHELYVAKIVFDEINSIAFISEDKEIFVSDNTVIKNTDLILESKQLKELKKTSGYSIWFPCEVRDFLVQDTSKPVLTLGKKVLEINTGKTLGYILLNIDISAINNILTNQLINYQLIDDNGRTISSVVTSNYIDKDTIDAMISGTGFNQVNGYMGRKYYISKYEIPEYGWNLIGITDLNEFNIDARKILYLVVIVAVTVIIFEFAISNYLSRIITVPLLKLKNCAEEIAGGNMKLRFHFMSNDEIGQLGKSINYMSEQVEELLYKVDYEAKKKREYELSLLHEQVKPHFLYNSLDIITKLSEMNRHPEARRAIRKLADYYRNSLSDSKEIITIGQEIKIVEDYIELQRMRYMDVFTYEIAIEEDVLQTMIPKLTLQPLIENAIYHGLKHKNEMGKIQISGIIQEKLVIISLEDNGVGMNEETKVAILQNNPDGHFGVYSVNHRIKLFFGEEYGVIVHSEAGIGTKIEILLPFTG